MSAEDLCETRLLTNRAPPRAMLNAFGVHGVFGRTRPEGDASFGSVGNATKRTRVGRACDFCQQPSPNECGNNNTEYMNMKYSAMLLLRLKRYG